MATERERWDDIHIEFEYAGDPGALELHLYRWPSGKTELAITVNDPRKDPQSVHLDADQVARLAQWLNNLEIG